MRERRSRISHSPSKTGVNALVCSIRATGRRPSTKRAPTIRAFTPVFDALWGAPPKGVFDFIQENRICSGKNGGIYAPSWERGGRPFPPTTGARAGAPYGLRAADVFCGFEGEAGGRRKISMRVA